MSRMTDIMERKMKDSGNPWIGMIPEHWEVHCLRGISKGFKKGNGITKEDLIAEGDTLCVRYGDLYTKYNQHICDIKCRTNLSKIQSPIYASFGDILFTCSGEDVSLIGKSVAFMSCEDCLVGGDLIIMKHEQNPRFLGYSLDSEMAQQQKSCGRSKLKVVHISVKDLKKIAIPIPPLAEQEAIASWLDEKCGDIDELIEVEQKMIEALESYRQATITEAVTRGLNPDAPMRQTGISWLPEIPEHWEICRLKDKLRCAMQYGANESGEPFKPELPRYIRITDISSDGKLKEDDKKSLSLDLSKPYILEEGDILFARSGATVGKAFIYHNEYGSASYAGYLIRAKVDTSLLPLYLFYYTQTTSYEQWKNGIFIQATIQNIGADKYIYLPICVPPLAEQQEIAEYLDAKCREIDELIGVKREKIETLKQYRQSIIFEAVTGKIQIGRTDKSI